MFKQRIGNHVHTHPGKRLNISHQIVAHFILILTLPVIIIYFWQLIFPYVITV